jgi:hypothetical protein
MDEDVVGIESDSSVDCLSQRIAGRVHVLIAAVYLQYIRDGFIAFRKKGTLILNPEEMVKDLFHLGH